VGAEIETRKCWDRKRKT